MRRKISEHNPFGYNAKGALYERLKQSKKKVFHLDYGAHDGELLNILRKEEIIEKGWGVDLNSKVVVDAQKKLQSKLILQHIKKNQPLPFPDHTFDVVSMIGVLEHINEQDRILAELRRVLKDDGEILIAVPGKHIFSFLDMGNWKFIFPKIHKWYYCRKYGYDAYETRYSYSPDGMIGDIESEKAWHQHYSVKELSTQLCQNGFNVIEADGFGLFNRIFTNLNYFTQGRLAKIFDFFVRIDARFFEKSEIWMFAKKKA